MRQGDGLTATTGDPSSSTNSASTLPRTTLDALLWVSTDWNWKHLHCFAAAVLPPPTWMTVFCSAMGSSFSFAMRFWVHLGLASELLRDLQEFSAGAMGSLLSPAPLLPPSSSPPSPRSPLSLSAMVLCGPGRTGLLEIPWCKREPARAPCLPTNARGPFLAQCRPQRTNKCNDTEMRTPPLNPSTHSPSATKPPHHSPKHPPIYESRHAVGYQSLHPPIHHQPKPASHPTQPKHPYTDFALGERGFIDNANLSSRKQAHMSGAMGSET